MGGFTSAPPVLAARAARRSDFFARFQHYPRAGQSLAFLDRGSGFCGFPECGSAACTPGSVTVTGTPVRPRVLPRRSRCVPRRAWFGPGAPGCADDGRQPGRQRSLTGWCCKPCSLASRLGPELAVAAPHRDRRVYSRKPNVCGAKTAGGCLPVPAGHVSALGAASVAVSRAGASSLAELAAMRLPAILVPFPNATDDHQWHNAAAFREAGAARLLAQKDATSEVLAGLVLELVRNQSVRASMRSALGHGIGHRLRNRLRRILSIG